ncbi:SHOCT domain-containing protein [Acholeplasma granularum]|uniref:SHOCT domain-containing protein n=1 Tax=Acholeplasma granularum TaxID=264635 RepID=UPI0004727695|nr:SHOCT domain-containing protein [Acholeplasma granularum]
MNKTLLTVAQVFSIISGALMIFPFGIFILPLILAFFNFKAATIMGKAKEGQATKEQVTNYSIYLIFTSTIAGICGLVAASTQDQVSGLQSVEQKLIELDGIYDKGLITKEEYEIRRKKIIESL